MGITILNIALLFGQGAMISNRADVAIQMHEYEASGTYELAAAIHYAAVSLIVVSYAAMNMSRMIYLGITILNVSLLINWGRMLSNSASNVLLVQKYEANATYELAATICYVTMSLIVVGYFAYTQRGKSND